MIFRFRTARAKVFTFSDDMAGITSPYLPRQVAEAEDCRLPRNLRLGAAGSPKGLNRSYLTEIHQSKEVPN